MKEIRYVVFLLLLVCSLPSNAQQLSFTPITTDDGLPTSEIYSCFRDHNGYMWFPSDYGLCRYNGFEFKVFKVRDGLSDNVIFHVTEDHKGRIWCAGMYGDVQYIQNDKVYSVKAADTLKKIMQGGKGLIRKIHADRNGKLWIATTYGMFWMDETENFQTCHIQPEIQGTIESYMYVSVDSTVLISFNYYKKINISPTLLVNANACIDRDGKRTELKYPISKTSTLMSPCGIVNEKGDIIFNFYNTIYRLSASGFDSLTTIPNSPICMFYDKDHVLWVGTMSKGVYCYRNNDFSKPSAHYLEGFSISGVCTDFEGGMWFSTLGKGLMYCPVQSVIDYSHISSLSQSVTGIGIIHSGLIFGTNDQKISVLNAETDSIRQLNLFKVPRSLYNVWQDSSWLYLAGSMFSCRVNNDFGGIESYGVTSGIGKLDSLQWSGSYDVALTHSGRRLFISDKFLFELQDSLVKVPGKTQAVTYRVQHRLAEMPSRSRSLFCTSRDEILVSCSNGLYEYRDETGLTLFDRADSSLVGKATCIAEDQDGRLWITTVNKGVIVCGQDKVIQLNEVNGQPFDYSTAIEFDQHGNAWVGTLLGLIKINVNYNDIQKSRIDRFDVSYGLISNEIRKICIFKGKVWVGTIKGLCAVDIASMKSNSFAPPVYISAIQVDDSLYSRFDLFPELRYDQNNFRFHIEALSFRGKKTLTYFYKLSGYDKEWHETNEPVLIYQNLPAGDYTLTVSARNNAGVRSSMPAVFSFTVPAPFWETWWFRELCLLMIGGLIFLVVRLRLRQIRMREEEKTHTNKLLSEFQLTALRAQMNPHFIFNAINSIQRFILQKNSDEAYGYLAKFSKLIRAVLNHSQQRVILLEEELDMLNLYLQLEQLRFTGKFEYHVEVEATIDSSQIYIPSMLIQPYVENAIWHGLMNLRGERNAELNIRIRGDDDLLRIFIEDNGVGRAAAKKLARNFTHKSLGMELSRQRLELMNQMPEEEKSSVVITDVYADDSSCGTRVEIIVRYNSGAETGIEKNKRSK